jgi:hypothetical protein
MMAPTPEIGTDDELWVEALEQLDWHKDKKPLTQLLRSDIELSPLVRSYLADLIERRISVRSNSNKHPPAYHNGLSLLNWHYLATHQQVDVYRQQGMSLADALQKAATKNGLDPEVLHKSYSGKHTSFRRARKKCL